MNKLNDIKALWERASAFIVNDQVCGDFSIDYLCSQKDSDSCAFYIYGEHGLTQEYMIDIEMLEAGEWKDSHTINLSYYVDRPLVIEAVIRQQNNTP